MQITIHKNVREWKGTVITEGLWMSDTWNITSITVRLLILSLPWPYFKNLTKFSKTHALYLSDYLVN